MSESKAGIIEKLNHISDDVNEKEIIERLYMHGETGVVIFDQSR